VSPCPLATGQNEPAGLERAASSSVKDNAWRGELELILASRAGRSVAVRQYHRGSLRVLRPHYLDASGQVTYAVVNPGGGYVDGDHYRVDLALDPGADLLLTTQSATKVYRSPRADTLQQTHVSLGAGARLEYLPDQLIAYRDSRYRQDTRVSMDPSATLVLADVVTPGWSPTGEPFRYDRVRLRTRVHMTGCPSVVDNLLLQPQTHGLAGLGFFEGYTHVGSLVVLDPRADDAALAEARDILTERSGHLRAGASATPMPGFAVRVLGRSTPEVAEAIEAVVNLVRARWFGQGAVNLRKY